MAEANILYLDAKQFDGGKSLRGGALVVNETTEPLEFRCTSAVRPTKLQKILWGARLDTHITSILLGVPLVQALAQEFTLIVARDLAFGDLRDELGFPVVFLSHDTEIEYYDDERKTEDEGETDDDTSEPTDENDQPMDILTDRTGRFEPIIVKCHPKHPEDVATGREILAPMLLTQDIFDPFKRISAALDIVHEEEAKKSKRRRS